MKTFLNFIFVFLGFTGYAQKNNLYLMLGTLMDGFFVDYQTVNLEMYFYVKDGKIETVGESVGYLRTKKNIPIIDYMLNGVILKPPPIVVFYCIPMDRIKFGFHIFRLS